MTATLRAGTARPALPSGQAEPAPAAVGRRRSAPHVLLGTLLVLLCAVAFAVTSLRVDPRTPVLAVARAVPVGHILAPADLSVVRIVPDAGMAVVGEDQRSSVLGRTVRLPLAASTLLSEAVLGPAAWPPEGQSLVAVPVKAGRAPDGLTAGGRVLVLVVPAQSGTSGTTRAGAVQAPATVVSVAAVDGNGTSVVSLLMRADDAVMVAGASGEVALVVQGGG